MKNKIAVLDIGSNSFHFIIATVSDSGKIKIIERVREVIRLGKGYNNKTKKIEPQNIEHSVIAIQKFKSLAESRNVPLHAVATSALREAINKKEFLKIIYERTGVSINVIDGKEEGRLINLGIKSGLPNLRENTLSIDIGGGSTEFILRKDGEIKFVESVKIGAVGITQRFIPDFILSDRKIYNAKKWIEDIIVPIARRIEKENIEQFIGTSGTILNVGMMIKAKCGEGISDYTLLNNYEFTDSELFEIEKEVLSRISIDERKIISGLDAKRADIIPAGIIILTTIFRLLKIEKMVISNYALKEGIIINYLR
jgi:exopolyphosphatase/guanosine-5'-triphosphate,3'-diphosphate pyrophosphatase